MAHYATCAISSFAKKNRVAHYEAGAPLLVRTSNGALCPGAPLVYILLLLLFCETTNGAPPAGAPLVTWDQLDILDSHTYPLTFPTSFPPPPSPSFRLPPPHLISTIDSSKLSGEITFFLIGK